MPYAFNDDKSKLYFPLPISRGGTGAGNATTARNMLGAVSRRNSILENFYQDVFTGTAKAINANELATWQIDVTKEGYIPISCSLAAIFGGTVGAIVFRGINLEAFSYPTVAVILGNSTSSRETGVYPTIQVIYVKQDILNS